MYFDRDHMDSDWGIAAMVVLMLLFLVVLGCAVVAAVVVARAQPHQQVPSSTQMAEQVLAERLARGEIDSAEYADRMSALTSLHRRT